MSISSFNFWNNSFLKRSVQLTCPIFVQHHISQIPGISNLLLEVFKFWASMKTYDPNAALLRGSMWNWIPNILVENMLFILNADFLVTTLNLILRVYHTSYFIMLPTCLIYFTISGCYLWLNNCIWNGCIWEPYKRSCSQVYIHTIASSIFTYNILYGFK
jgi:hypothetical protein